MMFTRHDPSTVPDSWRVSVSSGAVFLLLMVPAMTGCSLPSACCPHAVINDQLLVRTGQNLEYVPPGTFVLPPDVILVDGVSEDEAVATALSNNSAFQSLLTQLGMANGDLVQAGLLTNPSLSTFIPVSVKQWEWTLYLPIEAFLLRPYRVAVAEDDYCRVAQSLVQNGLTLVRDVRVAHADLGLSIAQWHLAGEAARIRQSIAEITQKRLERGDISELESMTAQIDELDAQANVGLLEQNVVMARARLAWLMGLPPGEEVLDTQLESPTPLPDLDAVTLMDEALRSRPDALAAQWAVAAAAERVKVARRTFLRIDASADANGRGLKGFEVGPGLRFDIPILNRNQGGRIRANAELQQALHDRDTVHDLIVREVRTAAAQWEQAANNLAILEDQVTPALQRAQQIAERGFADGGTDYLLVLQTTSQYLDARVRVLEQIAALRRARAELERGVGHPLGGTLPLAPLPTPIEALPAPRTDSTHDG